MNRLGDESSPYLRQHADNPVDWYPWGDDAFAAARADDKPILLSVGYSSCHWCHVMAHESFEDPDVAAVMNRLFVNVKVDREERPDVDAIYMQAVQSLTGHGGWPMTVFLTPDGRPFYGGTYYPPDDRHGLPGFTRVLEAIADAWATQRDEILPQADRLRDAIAQSAELTRHVAPGTLDRSILERAVTQACGQFDARHGGFGRAPKFPQAMTLDFLLRAYARDPRPEVLEVVTVTLDAMAAGGMYDQVGGGFHRYSVDDHWLVPHFEKMLYDQALLVGAYLHGWLVTGEARYRRVVEETIDYVLRDLRHRDGGFFSAEDADSEGVEGKFYCWSLEELTEVCGADVPEMIRCFGVTAGGNFEDPHTRFRGNILRAVDRTEDRSEAVGRGLAALRARRSTRVRPGLDDKVVLAWNALFVRVLMEAAAAFGRTDWLDAARTNVAFLLRDLRRPDGRLLRAWLDGRASIPGYADDYAALLEALLTMAELDNPAWLPVAASVADQLIALFADDEHGGVFTTGVDAEALIVRPKDAQDNATPAENSLTAHALLRLAALTGNDAYAARAGRWLDALAGVLADHPTAFAYLLGAVDRAVHPPIEIAIVGAADDPGRARLQAVVARSFVPGSVTLTAEPGIADSHSPLLAGRDLVDGAATAYVCRHFSCDRPTSDPETLAAQITAALTAP